jgi:pimeloyl-ACP methyl ester carboxylesterase
VASARSSRRSKAPDPLAVTTADGVALSGLRYGNADADLSVVFGHGFTGSQRNVKVVDFAWFLADSGLAVYTADFRGHGSSGGLSTFGEHEVHDLDAMVGVARLRHQRVVSVGSSMGGFVALRHAGLVGHVDAVIAISSPAVAGQPELARARVLGRLVGSARGRRLLERYGTRVGPFALVEPSPLALAPRIAPIPAAIVHGTRDRYVPIGDAHALYDALGDPRRLLILPRFGHGEAGFGPPVAGVLVDLIAELLRVGTTEVLG